MKKWKYEIDLTKEWANEWSNSNIHILAKKVADSVKCRIKDWDDADKWGYDLYAIIERLMETPTKEQSDSFNKENYEWHLENNSGDMHFEEIPLEWFDDCMRELYDFADAERIWIQTF
jgi:hypothetical protein